MSAAPRSGKAAIELTELTTTRVKTKTVLSGGSFTAEAHHSISLKAGDVESFNLPPSVKTLVVGRCLSSGCYQPLFQVKDCPLAQIDPSGASFIGPLTPWSGGIDAMQDVLGWLRLLSDLRSGETVQAA